MNHASRLDALTKEYMNLDKLTKHQKDLELAAAGATKYGIHLETSTTAISEVIESTGNMLLKLLSSPSEEATKRQALDVLRASIPSMDNLNISDVNIDMGVYSSG